MPRSTATQRQVARDFGTCLKFSTSGGGNEVIKTGITGVNYTEFSVSIWLKPFRQTGNSGFCDFWGIEGASASKLVLESNSSFPNVYIISGLAGGAEISTSKNMVSDGLWHNLVYTASKSGNSAVLYLDGVSIGTSVWNPASENITNFTVANRTTTDVREASGFYDEAILFSRSLTAAEVTGIYYGTSIPAERILYWKFDEGSGTSATDSSGNSNTGTITGATYSTDVVMKPRTTAAQRRVVRDFGTCLRFNGTNQYTSVPDSASLNITTTISIAFWIKRNSSGSLHSIISRRDFGGGTGYGVGIGANNLLFFVWYGVVSVDSTLAGITDFNWHHVVVTKDTVSAKFYIDGLLADTVANTDNGSSVSRPLQFGRTDLDRTGGEYKGLLDDVLIYNQVLTLSVIQSVFYGTTIPTTNLVGWWKFDEGSGTSATDSSGNSNTGTITGATYSTDVVMKPRTTVV